jgi:hypothetical protein
MFTDCKNKNKMTVGRVVDGETHLAGWQEEFIQPLRLRLGTHLAGWQGEFIQSLRLRLGTKAKARN